MTMIVLLIKAMAMLLTSSDAVAADWLDGALHIVLLLIARGCSWYAEKPADEQHRYGHGKIAYGALFVEATALLGGALGIAYEAYHSSLAAVSLHRPLEGALLLLLAGLVQGAMALGLQRQLRGCRHPILEGHALHLLTDSWASLLVIGSLFVVWWTGYGWIDQLVALLLAIQIAATALLLFRDGCRGLIERSDHPTHHSIEQLLYRAMAARQIEDFHQLRHRWVHNQLWIDLHMLFDGTLPLEEAHRRASLVEMELIALFPDDRVEVISHLEPLCHSDGHPLSHPDRRLALR